MLVVCATIGWTNCLEPTEVFVTIRTTANCSDVNEVSILTGTLAQINGPMTTTSTKACSDGRIGTIALVPPANDSMTDPAAIRVVLGLGKKTPDDCVKSSYTGGCIVARRAIRYITHKKLDLPIDLTLDCVDVPCDALTTCNKGRCVPADTACDTDAAGCDAGTTTSSAIARSIGGPKSDHVLVLARDPSGNVLAGGTIVESGSLGGPPLMGLGSLGNVWAASYDSSLGYRWQYLPTSQGDTGNTFGIAASPSRIGIVGSVRGPTNFGLGAMGVSGAMAAFFAQLDSTAKILTSQVLGVDPANIAHDIAYDAQGNSYVVGTCAKVMVGNTAAMPCSTTTGTSIFVISFDANGMERWSKAFGGPGANQGLGVAVTADGSTVLFAGSSEGPIDFGGGSQSGGGRGDAFVAALTTLNGKWVWSRVVGDPNAQQVNRIAVDGTYVYAVGSFEGLMADQDVPAVVTSAGMTDGFLWKLTIANGRGHQLRRFGGPDFDTAWAVSVAGSETADVCGQFAGTASLDGMNVVTSKGTTDAFVASVSNTATKTYVFGGAADDACEAITSEANALWIGGFYGQSIAFGGVTLTSAGLTDGYIAKVAR